MNVHDRIVRLEEKYMERILGLKAGTIDIGSMIMHGYSNEGLEKELGLVVKDRMIEIVDLRHDLSIMESVGHDFIMKFVLYMVGKFFSPMMKLALRRS